MAQDSLQEVALRGANQDGGLGVGSRDEGTRDGEGFRQHVILTVGADVQSTDRTRVRDFEAEQARFRATVLEAEQLRIRKSYHPPSSLDDVLPCFFLFLFFFAFSDEGMLDPLDGCSWSTQADGITADAVTGTHAESGKNAVALRSLLVLRTNRLDLDRAYERRSERG